jgi:hypothetical protein
MPPVGFEPTIPPSARPKAHALDRATTGIGTHYVGKHLTFKNFKSKRNKRTYVHVEVDIIP